VIWPCLAAPGGQGLGARHEVEGSVAPNRRYQRGEGIGLDQAGWDMDILEHVRGRTGIQVQ
jgi:hypothetical protein